MAPTDGGLRYLEPERVNIAGRRAVGMEVLTADGRFLGHLQGFLVDAAEGQVNYIVLRPAASSPAVAVAASWGAQVDQLDGVIRLDSADPELHPTGTLTALPFPPMSDRDLQSGGTDLDHAG